MHYVYVKTGLGLITNNGWYDIKPKQIKSETCFQLEEGVVLVTPF